MLVLAGALRWIHLFAAAAWIGGLFFYLDVFLPSLGEIDAGQARRLSQIVAMRFRAVATISLLALLATGLWLASQILQGVSLGSWLASSLYSRALGLKIVLALLATGIGLYIGFGVAPALVTAIEARDESRVRVLGRKMGMLTRTCFLLGVLITVCLAVMRLYS